MYLKDVPVGVEVVLDVYFIPKIFPALARRPLFVVGMPVALAIFLFTFVTPNAFLGLNDSPGMIDFFLFAIYFISFPHICIAKLLLLFITSPTRSLTFLNCFFQCYLICIVHSATVFPVISFGCIINPDHCSPSIL